MLNQNILVSSAPPELDTLAKSIQLGMADLGRAFDSDRNTSGTGHEFNFESTLDTSMLSLIRGTNYRASFAFRAMVKGGRVAWQPIRSLWT